MSASARDPLATNLLSSYAYIGVMALITLFALPLYARILGPQAWGDVALCLTLQGVLFSLDIVLAPLLLRDVSRAAPAEAARIHARFQRLYGVPALALFALGQIALSAIELPPPREAALRLALVGFLFQFCNLVPCGYWHAQQRQGFANLRLAGFALVRHGAALVLILAWSADATMFMLPFALVGAIEFAVNHRHVRRELTSPHNGLDSSVAPFHWRDYTGFGAAALLGVCTSQIDRIVLSMTLSVADYGIYFLAASLLASLLSLQMPIQRAFLPRLADAPSARDVAVAMLRVQIVLVALPALLLAATAPWALTLWLHDAERAARVAPIFRVLMIALAAMALYAPAATLLLDRHRNGTLAGINVAILLAQAVVLWIALPSHGPLAGAYAWLACGIIQAGAAGAILRPRHR